MNNEIALGGRKFKDTAAIVEWCREVKDDEARSLRLKAVRDLVLRQQEMLEDFAAEFMPDFQDQKPRAEVSHISISIGRCV